MKYVLYIVIAMLLAACAKSENIQGPVGPQGERGEAGLPGQDGEDGKDGQAGKNAFIEVLNPCGQQNAFDELLFRLNDGSLMAYFERNGKRFLTLIPPGTYQTTDESSCVFTINENNECDNCEVISL